MTLPAAIAGALRRGGVIPAHPLALDRRGRFDDRRQRALTRYYLDAGAIGLAIGVHTTQFAIRDPRIGLHRPVLELGRDAIDDWAPGRPIVRIAGVVGPTRQAVREATVARDLGYQVALVSLGGLGAWPDRRLLGHLRAVGTVLPVMGFYLQPAVGGRPLSYRFWREAAELPGLVAIKAAPFDRYRTLDLVRAVAASGRSREIALYTGNDDAIVADLTARFRFPGPDGRPVSLRFVGGLLGHWACWTRRAVALVGRCRELRGGALPGDLARIGTATTDANGALFDAANGFRGCIAGIHEILRRQGLLASRRCLDPHETLSPGQARELDRVTRAYPFLTDDRFVADGLDRWLR
ncbi:MAG: dihydrodipicolinate synthase family protein [Gemmatimonadales bacterium]|nr:dihydrodipicolinate synthase family protein [Gemmatimonadales bacterium]